MPSGRQKKLGLGSRQAANSVSRQVSVTRALCGWLLRKCRLVERAAGQGGLVVVLFGHSQGGLSWEVVAGEQSTVYGPSGVAKTGDGEDTTGGVGYCYIPQANASGLLQYQSAAAATAEGGGLGGGQSKAGEGTARESGPGRCTRRPGTAAPPGLGQSAKRAYGLVEKGKGPVGRYWRRCQRSIRCASTHANVAAAITYMSCSAATREATAPLGSESPAGRPVPQHGQDSEQSDGRGARVNELGRENWRCSPPAIGRDV